MSHSPLGGRNQDGPHGCLLEAMVSCRICTMYTAFGKLRLLRISSPYLLERIWRSKGWIVNKFAHIMPMACSAVLQLAELTPVHVGSLKSNCSKVITPTTEVTQSAMLYRPISDNMILEMRLWRTYSTPSNYEALRQAFCRI